MSKVAACVIASEVLNGKTVDTNSAFLAKKCFEYGIRLATIRVIPDELDFIKSTVRELSMSYDLVVTSGGIGPTHDDITYPAISEAFGRSLKEEPSIVKEMMKHMKIQNLNEGQRRMARIPTPDQIIFTPNLWVPLVQVKNVLIFPGVSYLFQTMLSHWMDAHLRDYKLSLEKCIRKLVKTWKRESELAKELTELQDQVASEGIQLGSYPNTQSLSDIFVVISIIGADDKKSLVEKTAQQVKFLFKGEDYESSSNS